MGGRKCVRPRSSTSAVGYIRVSTEEQTLGPEAQRVALARWAEARKIQLVAVHEDRGVSGAAPLDRRPEALGEALAIGGDPALAVIDHRPTHPLLGAVHVAFAEHRPLVLSPDVVWLTIAQGVAQHVRLHAESLRPRLVHHAGRKELRVDQDGPLPTGPAAWSAIVSAFRDRLGDELGAGRARLFECEFSTSTDVERVCGRIALMDVYSPYFDYNLSCVCGIPEVTLLGTPDDWRKGGGLQGCSLHFQYHSRAAEHMRRKLPRGGVRRRLRAQLRHYCA